MSDSLIRVLPSHVIDRIAAGEVVERPSSVVKELCENAVDAGAGAIHVDIDGGGLERISVSDDGCGMSPPDATLALERHATSKLWEPEDLSAIRTLGFRGEALSSIASVCRMTLTTRRAQDDVGTRVLICGGEVESMQEIGCPVGTTVDVRNIFYNTPARRAFMRSAATEQAHVVDAVTRVVLGARKGGVLLTSGGGRHLLDLPEDGSEANRVCTALGKRVTQVYPFEHQADSIRVSGYVTRPDVNRGDAQGMWLFVNGRFVRDRMLQRAVLEGFRSLLERGRYPYAVVFLDVDPAAVDVNVHPQKLEVRFQQTNPIFRAVASTLNGTLARSPWLSGDGLAAPQTTVQSALRQARDTQPLRVIPEPLQVSLDDMAKARLTMAAVSEGELCGYENLTAAASGGPFSTLRPVGQVMGVYLLCEGDGAIFVIDQHAAHERVAFERLRAQRRGGDVVRQSLLFPEIIEVSSNDEVVLSDNAAAFLRLGFEIELVGPRRWAVRSIPAELAGADAKPLVNDLLDEVGLLGRDQLAGAAEDQLMAVLSRIACHAAVRAGDNLKNQEIAALLTQMDSIDFGAHCPHGRPVYHRIGRAELDRIFHRS